MSSDFSTVCMFLVAVCIGSWCTITKINISDEYFHCQVLGQSQKIPKIQKCVHGYKKDRQKYTLNGGIKPIPVPYISADNRSTHNLSTSSIKKVHHHQVNGGIPAGNVHATTLSRPSSRAGSRARSRSRSKSRPRSHSRPRNSRQNLNTSYGSSSHSISNGVPPTSIFPRHHQSSLSGQSHFSHTDSTGRLLAVPVQRMSRY